MNRPNRVRSAPVGLGMNQWDAYQQGLISNPCEGSGGYEGMCITAMQQVEYNESVQALSIASSEIVPVVVSVPVVSPSVSTSNVLSVASQVSPAVSTSQNEVAKVAAPLTATDAVSWMKSDSVFAGISNMYIVAAVAAALLLMKKKRSA